MMKQLNGIIANILKIPVDSIEGEMTIDEVESWDSLSHMNLITSIEEEYDIQLTGDDIAEMASIHAIHQIVKKYL